jgi:V8-like Glu-specific endopeptidase
MKYLVLILSFTTLGHAAIYGTDDRLDIEQVQNSKLLEISKSTPALVPKSKLKLNEDGDYEFVGKTLQDYFNFCDDSFAATQPMMANCSAALIGKDTILTAAHCIDPEDGKTYSIENYYVVFDYANYFSADFSIPSENVYEIEQVLHYEFDQTLFTTGIDITTLKLKRVVTDRVVLEIDFDENYSIGTSLYLLGYPLGSPLKLSTNGEITDHTHNSSFAHNLDAFSVNSGSPIFNADTHKIIGVHVRGLGSNTSQTEASCFDWTKATPEFYDEGNMTTLLPLR